MYIHVQLTFIYFIRLYL